MARVAVIRCGGYKRTQYVPIDKRPPSVEQCSDCDGWRQVVRVISDRPKAAVPVAEERRAAPSHS